MTWESMCSKTFSNPQSTHSMRIGTLEKERAELLSRIATLEARVNDQKEKIRDVENELKHTFGITARIQGQFDAYTLFQQQIKKTQRW